MSSKTLYIIRGVPGSGKSTLAHQLTKNVVETDDFMMVDGEYKYDKDKVYACHKKCFNKVLDYMAHNVTPIAVANTFIKKKDYKPYVDLAKEFGYDVEIKVCKGEFKNVHNVPQDRVEQMKSKFQESINSLLEMNGDVGITETIENKKQSVRIKVDESNNFLSKNVKFVTSPSQLLSILKSQNSGYRILYDKNLDMYMIGHEEEVIHQDMLEYAYKSGLYYNLEDFIDGVGGLQNYIEIGVDGGYDSQDNEIEPYLFYMIFDPYNEWKIGDDGYDNLYKLKFGNLLTRKCDIKDIPLYNLLVSKDVFEPNQIKSIKNNGNWSLDVDNINEEKEIIEERLFPELSDRKYNELLWFTTPNMTANAYTKFFGKEMVADKIPAKYLVALSSNDISLKDLVEKHRKLYNAKQVKPIADYKDFNDFITDLNKSKYLTRNDKSNIAKSGAKIIKSFGDWDLYDITSWEAAKKYGSGTTWCVTDSTSDDYFKRYTNRLPFNNYQTEEDMKKSKRSLLFLINPNTDRKMAISVVKRMDYDWYDDEIEFYNEEDEFFYTYSHTTEGNISLKDNIMEKISYSGDDWPDADVVEDYGVTEDFINSVTQFIKDTYRMNKEQIVEDINKLRQKYKQLMNIKESANNSTNNSINEVLKLSGVTFKQDNTKFVNKLNKFGMNIKESANNSTNMTWEEFVEKVGRINEFDGSVVILKHNTSIVIRQSGTILIRIGKNPFKKAYSNLKTFDEIYNMLVEKGFIEEQLLTEAVNQHSLYHGCDLAYAVSMMIENTMRGETIANINGKKYQGNSLTRSLQFAKDWQDDRWDGYGDELNQFWVVLEFNKERLKTKYKVLPYNYWEEYFGQDYEHTIDRNGYGDQYEEFVVGRIINLRNYLDDVHLSPECFDVEYAEMFAIVKRELELRGENYTDSQIVKALQTLGIDKPSPDDFDSEKLNENYGDMPMVYPNPTYSEFHDIMRRFTTTGTLSAIIDGDNIYCWDSYLKHHDTMFRYIENKMDIKISDNAIWVRFKEPNICWVSAAYFDDYNDDELEDLETQDFEKELKYNPVIRKYFPKGVKIVRFNRKDEPIVYDDESNTMNEEYEGLNRIAGFYWFDEHKFQMLKRKPVGVDNLSDDDDEFDYYHLEKMDGLIEDNKARFGIEKLGKKIVCYIEAETKSKCLRAKKAILRKYPDIVFDRFDLSWENNGFETLNEAHSYYINNVKLYENPSIQWMRKKLNSGIELRILIDGDLSEPYFGDWIVWDAAEANHQKVLNSLNLYEEDYISVRLCKDSILYWGYTKEKIDKLQECETIQKLYPNGYELISEW